MYEASFASLPDHIIIEIFQYLHLIDLIPLVRVCKHWQSLISDQWLWRKVKLTPIPIKKVKLSQLIRRYFRYSTRSLDICGKPKRRDSLYAVSPKSSYCLSNNVLNILYEKSPNLVTFKIEDDNLKGIEVKLLPSTLEHLEFTSCEIPLSSLITCPDHFTDLNTLVFRNCPCLNDSHLKCFGKLESLQRLEIIRCYRIDHDAVRIIAANCPKVRYLSMIGCAFCGDNSCDELAANLKDLKSLEIEEWTNLSQDGVDKLRKTAKNLKFLSVKCTQIHFGHLTVYGSRMLL